MTVPNPGRPEPAPDAGVDDLQADIATTRDQLGETVEALSAKLDVKAQAKQKVDQMPLVPIAAVALIAIVGIVIWRRRR
jgi:hypothetical protein